MDHLTRFEALKLAFDKIGTQQQCADLLEVSQPTIWRWLNQTKQLPAEYVLKIEAATGVSRHDLRPDIYPRECMVDRHVGARFAGLDRQVGIDPIHAGHSIARAQGFDFNTSQVLKGAAR